MKLSMEFEILDLLDECIAVPTSDSSTGFQGVLKLNEEAAAILRLLAEDTSEERIAEELLKEYSVSKEDVLTHIHNFVEQLRSNGLITE